MTMIYRNTLTTRQIFKRSGVAALATVLMVTCAPAALAQDADDIELEFEFVDPFTTPVNTSAGSRDRIRIGGTETGTLAPRTDDGRDQVYVLELSAGETVQIDLTAADEEQGFDAVLLLHDGASGEQISYSDDDGIGLNSRLRYTAERRGVYWIVVREFNGSGGDYALSVEPYVPQTIAMGETVTGMLSTAGNSQSYIVSANAGDRLTFSMTSDDFDTYLSLYGPDGGTEAIAYNDDGGEGLNSLLSHVAETSGSYTIEANSFAAAGEGSFTLMLTDEEVEEPEAMTEEDFSDFSDFEAPADRRASPRPDPEMTAVGQTITGALTADAPRQLYGFEAEAGDHVLINLTSDEFDTYLYLYGPESETEEVSLNDDSRGTLNSQIRHRVTQTGTYTVEVNSFATGSEGSYTLTLGEVPPPPPPVAISVGSTVSGEFSDDSPMLDDDNAFAIGPYAVYTLRGRAGQTLVVRMDAVEAEGDFGPQIDPLLEAGVITPFGFAAFDYNDDTNGLNAQITLPFTETTTVAIRASAFGAGMGAYTLSVTEE